MLTLLIRKRQFVSVCITMRATVAYMLMKSIKWKSFSRKMTSFQFSTSWFWIPLEKWTWLVTSWIWSKDIVWKWLLLCKLHIKHMTKIMTSSLIYFWAELPLFQVSTSYHTRKLRFQGCLHPQSTNNICKKSSAYEGLTLGYS